jgi:hypothetical protein
VTAPDHTSQWPQHRRLQHAAAHKHTHTHGSRQQSAAAQQRSQTLTIVQQCLATGMPIAHKLSAHRPHSHQLCHNADAPDNRWLSMEHTLTINGPAMLSAPPCRQTISLIQLRFVDVVVCVKQKKGEEQNLAQPHLS